MTLRTRQFLPERVRGPRNKAGQMAESSHSHRYLRVHRVLHHMRRRGCTPVVGVIPQKGLRSPRTPAGTP